MWLAIPSHDGLAQHVPRQKIDMDIWIYIYRYISEHRVIIIFPLVGPCLKEYRIYPIFCQMHLTKVCVNLLPQLGRATSDPLRAFADSQHGAVAWHGNLPDMICEICEGGFQQSCQYRSVACYEMLSYLILGSTASLRSFKSLRSRDSKRYHRQVLF